MIFFLFIIYLMMLSLINWTISLMLMIFNQKMIIEWNMFFLNSLKINYHIFIDWMTLMFISTVMLITSLVIMYSMSYMNNHKSIKRFMMLIMIFMSSMIFMIISPNMISILLGWDGLGLSSYCLVNFYQNKKSFNSSMITILMNRIGDIMILLSISIMITWGSWNFMFLKKINFLLTILFMCAAFTKSAQIPFSSWLPLAMAAPTPISSLVHSSTLVTAGVYIIIRFHSMINKNFLLFMMIMSCLTMILSGSSAIYEFDLKKIIALSTLSQLGVMVMAISFQQTNLAFFHLITHAMFKSLLFLCSGIIIHNFFNHQDIRFINMINKNMPFISVTMNIASLSLCGFPFLTGFYSKDFIIEMFIMNNKFINIMTLMIMFISMMLTFSYTLRLIFFISIKTSKMFLFNKYQSWNWMNYSIIILMILSMIYGSILNWILFSSMNLIFLSKYLKMMIYMFMIFSLMNFYFILKMKNINMLYFLNNMWFLPLIFKKNKINLLYINNYIIFKIDLNWLEYFSSKMMIFMMNKLKEFKIMKLNFMTLFLMILYLIYMKIMI